MARQKELDESRRKKLRDIYVELLQENKKRSTKLKNKLPIIKASKKLKSPLNFFKKKYIQEQREWEIAYENFSWWDKMKYSSGPDYSENKTRIEELEEMNANFKEKHGESLSKLNDHLKHQFNMRKHRIEKAYDHALKVQPQYKNDILDGEDLIRKSFWCAIFSVPVSASLDFINAHNVYDTLRHVNKNYLDMSDVEIWWTTLWMAPEKLQGLASLTKGAYFEGLVAANTGGQLHEHFNHPGTDIVIDGEEMQIKATDSIDYINSVDDAILVIATSEVAAETGSIDGGYTNEELTNSVALALGGSVVDIPDTAVDAILSGVGGLGILATLKGLNPAAEQHKKDGDDLKAICEGAEVAITQTAKTLVDISEMGWKVASSRPSHFIGRTLVNTSKMGYKVATSGPSRFIGRNLLLRPSRFIGRNLWKIGKKFFGG